MLDGMMLSPYRCQFIPWESNKDLTGSDQIVSSTQPTLNYLKHSLSSYRQSQTIIHLYFIRILNKTFIYMHNQRIVIYLNI